ncbi:hypothetical protein [Liquorilactobacillus uvarum]|nr:hypothetical protein [Liquorilactobacillus uvarum]
MEIGDIQRIEKNAYELGDVRSINARQSIIARRLYYLRPAVAGYDW